MGNYRAYCSDGNGQVWVEDRIEAKTDEEAMRAASAIPKAVKVEIRDETRLVNVVENWQRWR